MAEMLDLQKLLDRETIRNVVLQYCRAFDRCDAELLEDVYWPDSIHEHGMFKGSGSEFVAFAIPKIRSFFKKSQHTLGNFYVDIRGDTAFAETYVTAHHLIPNDPQAVGDVFGEDYARVHADAGAKGHDFIFLGRYIDVLEKRNGHWRIKHRRISTEWSINQPSTAIWEGGLAAGIPFLGRRDRTDPSYFDFAAVAAS